MRNPRPSASTGRALIIALVPALLMAGGGAFLLLGKGKHARQRASAHETAQVPVEEMVVNLADTDRPRYLTLSVTLVLAGHGIEKKISQRDAQIRDAVLMVTSAHKYRDLLAAEGKDQLKHELASAVGRALEPDGISVEDVLITNFLME